MYYPLGCFIVYFRSSLGIELGPHVQLVLEFQGCFLHFYLRDGRTQLSVQWRAGLVWQSGANKTFKVCREQWGLDVVHGSALNITDTPDVDELSVQQTFCPHHPWPFYFHNSGAQRLSAFSFEDSHQLLSLASCVSSSCSLLKSYTCSRLHNTLLPYFFH